MATAARIDGSIVNQVCQLRARTSGFALRIGMPSGVLQVDANVRRIGAVWHVDSGSFYRTQRRLFEGNLLIPQK
jgi:2-methylaconitate cis-trans-isomerase PrpF